MKAFSVPKSRSRALAWRLAAALCALALLTAGCEKPTVDSPLLTIESPSPKQFVVDDMGLLDDQLNDKLEIWLNSLELETGADVRVMTIGSSGFEELAAFSLRHFNRWGIGEQDKNNGVLIVLASDDGTLQITTGSGMEKILPDAWCGALCEDVATKEVAAAQFAAAVDRLTASVVAEVAAHHHVDVPGAPMNRFVVPKEPTAPPL